MKFHNLQKLDYLDHRIPDWKPFPHEQRECPFCGNNNDPIFLRPDSLPVAQCQSCRCFYVAVRVPDAALQQYYNQYWEVTCSRPLTDEMAMYLTATAKKRFAGDHCLKKLTALLGSWKAKRVLDVGCGFGEKASIMKSLEADVLGIDISPSAVLFCSERLGIAARCTTIEGLPEQEDTFDVVTMFEFVEHPIEPFNVLRAVVSRMKVGAFLAIVTPNGTAGERWWYAREKEWVGFRVDLEHLQYLHVDTIDYLCHTLNCRQVHLEQLGHRPVDDIIAPRRFALSSAVAGLVSKRLKKIPGMRHAVYAVRDFQAKLRGITQRPLDEGDYHLFVIFQKIA